DGVPGCTRLAQRFLRWTTNCTDEFRTLLPGEIADLIELLKHSRRLRGVVSYAAWLNGALCDYKTMQRMNLCTIEELITGLVQFLACEAEPIEGDPLKAAERSLVGMRIDGFYPTPPNVIDLMLDQVEIEEGMLCLEPSAGSGKIADALRDRGGE